MDQIRFQVQNSHARDWGNDSFQSRCLTSIILAGFPIKNPWLPFHDKFLMISSGVQLLEWRVKSHKFLEILRGKSSISSLILACLPFKIKEESQKILWNFSNNSKKFLGNFKWKSELNPINSNNYFLNISLINPRKFLRIPQLFLVKVQANSVKLSALKLIISASNLNSFRANSLSSELEFTRNQTQCNLVSLSRLVR